MVYYNTSVPARVRNVTLCSQTKDTFCGLYLPAVHRGASKGHGIIRINLNKVMVDTILVKKLLKGPSFAFFNVTCEFAQLDL